MGNKMKTLGLIASLSLFASTVWAAPVNIEIIDTPNQRWEFHRVTASERDNSIIISGQLNAPLTMPRPFGHVDVAAYAPNGDKIAETTTSYVPSNLSPKLARKGGVRFSATLPGSLPPGSTVKVAFHAEPVTKPAPSHSATIAK
jgi:hypothetical protein